MKSFRDYYRLRENDLATAEPDDQSINPSEADEHKVLFKLIRIAWKNHNSTTKAFFRKLSQVNPEIAAELGRLNNDEPEMTPDTEKRPEKDIVRPNLADTGTADAELNP